MPSLIVIGSNAPERLAVYIVKGDESEVIKTAQSLHQWFTVVSLTAASTQTPNPWGGTLLKEVAFTHPTDAFTCAIRYASYFYRDLPEHQRDDAMALCVSILDEAVRPKITVERTTDLPPVENMPLGGDKETS
jgi:hypothetical protein